MINVDHHRCAYCGGCASVHAVGSLTLAETRLLVSDNCIDCGDCDPACSEGALHLGPRGLDDCLLPGRAYDVVVVGAGPGGYTAARLVRAYALAVSG
jgi:NAD-dependent dihydropyrimidine dehydrogenase PreA subunit